jgi:hypothetical protein
MPARGRPPAAVRGCVAAPAPSASSPAPHFGTFGLHSTLAMSSAPSTSAPKTLIKAKPRTGTNRVLGACPASTTSPGRERMGCLDVLVGEPVTPRYRGGCAGREPTQNRARCMPSWSVRVSCRAIMEAVHSGACRRGQRTDADGVLSRTCAAHLVSAGRALPFLRVSAIRPRL